MHTSSFRLALLGFALVGTLLTACNNGGSDNENYSYPDGTEESADTSELNSNSTDMDNDMDQEGDESSESEDLNGNSSTDVDKSDGAGGLGTN